MNSTIFAILVLGFFALTKARSDVRQRCTNDSVCKPNQNHFGFEEEFTVYKCVHGICKPYKRKPKTAKGQ